MDFLTAPFVTGPPQARDAPTVGVITTRGMKDILFPEWLYRGMRGFEFPANPVCDTPTVGVIATGGMKNTLFPEQLCRGV